MNKLVLYALIVPMLYVPSCTAQEQMHGDINDDGVIDEKDFQVIKRERQRRFKLIRSSAPHSNLVPGLYLSTRDSVGEGLCFSYVHVRSGKYVYYYSDFRFQLMDVGSAKLVDGWLHTQRTHSLMTDIYWYPHRLGERDVLFSEQGWETWRRLGKIDPSGVLIRADLEQYSKLLKILPAIDNISPKLPSTNE